MYIRDTNDAVARHLFSFPNHQNIVLSVSTLECRYPTGSFQQLWGRTVSVLSVVHIEVELKVDHLLIKPSESDRLSIYTTRKMERGVRFLGIGVI